jgi:hypothetical protein
MRDAILVGSQEEFFSYLPQTAAREEQEQRLANQEEMQTLTAAQQDAVRATAAQILSDGISRLSARIDQFEKARALSAKRAEAQRKARDAARVQRYLDELPDPENPDPDDLYSIDPKEREAIQRDTTQRDGTELPPPKDPTGVSLENDNGDLEAKPPVDPEKYGTDEYPGNLPRELKKDVPAPSGSYTDPKPDPLGGPEDPHQVQQPISASLW